MTIIITYINIYYPFNDILYYYYLLNYITYHIIDLASR
jgi:hypothetical protein